MKEWRLPDIYLLDMNPNITYWWERCFKDEEKVHVVCDEFSNFMEKHTDNITIVSPANSYGIMDGGLDAAILEHVGEAVQRAVQEKILDEFLGELPVGAGLKVDVDTDKNIKLILTPTMIMPGPILDHMVVYHCMRTALTIAVKDSEIRNIVIPAFGGLTGQVPPSTVARQMYAAYLQIKGQIEDPHIETWNSAIRQRMKIIETVNSV